MRRGLVFFVCGLSLLFKPVFSFAKLKTESSVNRIQASETKNHSASVFKIKELAQRVEELMSERKRKEALALIRVQLSTQTKNLNELIELINQTSEIFLYEKTQQLYEQSSSLFVTDPRSAKEKINLALALEPDNLLLLDLKAWLLLVNNEYSAALETAQSIYDLNPINPEGLLLKAKAYLGLSNFEKFEEVRSSVDLKKLILSQYKLKWTVLDLESAFKRNMQDKLNDLLKEIKKDKKAGLEASYWLWKTQKEMVGFEQDASLSGQKILNICKNMSPKQQRENISEISICKKINEVEAYMKKSSQPE